MNRNYCRTSAAVFSIIALMHIWRLVMDPPVQIGAWGVPRSLSLVGALVAGLLAGWAIKCATQSQRSGQSYG